MPDIEVLGSPTINYNSIGTQGADRVCKCSTNTANSQGSGCEEHYTHIRQEVDRPGKCCTNTDSNSHSKPNNVDIPKVNSSKIYYSLAGCNQDNENRGSAEITQQLKWDFKGVFNGVGCFDGIFSLQVKPDSKPY